MKTILVPTDFSNAAQNAAEYAVHFAKDINAKILLLHVYNLPMLPVGEVPTEYITTDELQIENEKSLEKEVRRLSKITAIEIQYKAKMGLAVDEIVEEEKGKSFIIMGMTGAGKLSELLLGSITTATLKQVQTPVIVVPENISYKKPERIVLSSDYNPSTNEQTLHALNDLVALFKSKIYIVNVKKKKEEILVESEITNAKLETELKGSAHFYYFPVHNDLVEGVNEFVEAKKADMIVVIPHQYTFMERLFHKSFSKKMAFHTHVPLLVLPKK